MKQNLLKSIADLRFAIFILLVIASFSIIGTVIEQDQSIETYKVNYPLTNPVFGFLSWDLILKFGLDHVYRTSWFIGLIIIFGASLLTCTFLQQVPSLKISRRCQFFRTPQQFLRLKNVKKIDSIFFSKILFSIKQKNYSIFQQKNIIYCYKGLIGRIGPVIVHFSMILILLGTILTALTGFKAQEIVPKTETFHIQNVLTNGPLTIIPKASARVNDFWITYSKQKIVSQFYSDISILNANGNEIEQKTIYVNSPAKFNGLTYYQTDWNLIGIRIKNNANSVIQYPLSDISNNRDKIWLSWIPKTAELTDGYTLLVNNLQGYGSIYGKSGQFLGNVELNETSQVNSNLAFIDIISSTGLQIKADPGIPIIYSGFAFLMGSTLLSYVTYSQIWIVDEKQTIFIGGNTNRATFDFELEFLDIVKSKLV